MALINCKECGKEISTEASVCPHCGYKLPRKSILPKILIGLAVAVGLFVGSAIYAGHREGNEAILAVKDRLNTFQNVQVTISKYVHKANNYYVCGMVAYRTDGANPTYKPKDDKEKSNLFVVIETGLFPSVFSVTLDTDAMFNVDYFPTCQE